MKKNNWLYAGGLGLVAAILYFVSTAGYAYPGDSAHLMAVWRGLTSDATMKYPFMAAVVRLLGGGNLIAPICGVVSVVALFHLVASFVGWRVTAEGAAHRKHRLAMIAASTAAVVFMLTPAVRSAATHLEPRLFDFTWALLTLALALPFLRWGKGGGFLYPFLLAVLVAVGATDSTLFLTFLPFYAVLTVKVAHRQEKHVYLPFFVFAVTGILAFAAAVKLLDAELIPTLKVLSKEFKDLRTPPGWLFVAAFSTLPFAVALFSSKKAFGEKSDVISWTFHGALTFVSILAVATPLSPSALMEPYGVLPVATSAFAAAVAGYLVAYWWMNLSRIVGMIAGGVFVFVLGVTCLWNLFTFDGDDGAFADQMARKVLADMGSRRWFVSDGTLDDHIKMIAADEGRAINLIDLSRDLDEKYLAELGELIEKEGVGGPKNGTLRLSLQLGVLPFVQDWFASDPSVVKDVAIYGAPDLWYSAGITPVPEFVFFGADSSIEPDWNCWKEFDALLHAPKGWGSYHGRDISNPVERLRLHLRRHLGFVANNRGVYLQDRKQDDAAFAMYEKVLNEIDHDNICSIFNEVGMVDAKHPQALQKKRELERMLKAAVEDKSRRYILWRLGTYYGYIRNPDLFVRLGHAWARSGRPGDALSQIRRAIDFVPTDKKTILLNMMAALYANENNQQKSRAIFEQVLAENKNDHDALIGLMRLELLEGNSQKALEYLERAAENSGDGKRAKIELAMVAMMKNDLRTAKDLLKKATDFDPKDMQAWSLLASVTMQQIDQAKSEKEKVALQKELDNDLLPSMEKRAEDQFDYHLQATKGFVLLRQGEDKRREARDAFAAASKARPDIASTQNLVMGLDISLDDKASAEDHAKDALRRNRNAPLANYIMGSLALGRGKYTEAETYLRKAADAPQPVVLALNDLAEVLRRNKNYVEAERYARKATEKAPGLYVAWETLGSVLMDANKSLDEAEAYVRKACELSKDKDGNNADIRMLVSLARVQIRRGDAQHAKVTIRKVRARIDELSEFEKREFDDFTKSMR